jgi:two-component system response regulator HydG
MTDKAEIKRGRVLVVDDDEDVLRAARLFLKRHLDYITTINNPRQVPAAMAEDSFDVILLDMNFTRDVTSGQEGFQWLQRIREIDSDAVVILITAFGDTDTAVRAIKAGATDFVIKPWQNEKLLATVMAGVELRHSRRQVHDLETRQKQLQSDIDQPFHEFVGVSDAMQSVFRLIAKVADTEANVLILGENGTGKELVARSVHRQSARSNGVFCKVDMGALSESLFESELFGHTRGAFTDARDERPGRFEIASGGTLFLDEIGNLPLPLQPKLLTVLQSRQVTRVGSNAPVAVDIRLICASNLSLDELAAAGRFREDLLYRINTVEIHVPALRERPDDIPVLARHFLAVYCRKYRKTLKRISPAAMTHLMEYPWPGNVRELQHAVERAVILGDAPVLEADDFLLVKRLLKDDDLVLDDVKLDAVEATVIRRVLARSGGNITHAAKALGLTRAALYRRLEKYGI